MTSLKCHINLAKVLYTIINRKLKIFTLKLSNTHVTTIDNNIIIIITIIIIIIIIMIIIMATIMAITIILSVL